MILNTGNLGFEQMKSTFGDLFPGLLAKLSYLDRLHRWRRVAGAEVSP